MGGPNYQTPYPVDDGSGGKVIWSWDTKSWSPYRPPVGPAVGPETREEGGRESTAGASTAPDQGWGGPSNAGDRSVEQYLVPKGTKPTTRRRSYRQGALPGSSLLMDEG